MANTLRFKRGLVSGIPTAALGEPLFTTDTFDLYIGNGTGNTRFQKYIASGATTQILRGDGSLYTFPLAISSPTNGQVLKYNGTSWVNDSDSGITGSGSAGQVAYFTGATTQGGSNNLFWDATNSRLGVGTASPTTRLYVTSPSANTTFDSGSASDARLEFRRAGTRISLFNWDTGLAGFQMDTGSYFYLSTGGTERMRLTANGRLLLGTTTEGTYLLDVNGVARISGTNGLSLLVGNTTSTSTTTPLVLSLGGTFGSNTAGSTSNIKLRIFDENNATSHYGIGVSASLLEIHSNNSIGFFTGGTATRTERMRIDANGSVGIGTTSLTEVSLRVSKQITGGALSYGIISEGQVQSAVSTVAYNIQSTANVATGFTLPNYVHYRAVQGTISGTVTNQFGYVVSPLTSGTNIYGFYGDIASGTGRWNLYMNGTAANYLAGSLGIGITSPTIKLQVENNENAGNGIWTRNTNSGTAALSYLTTVSNAGQININAYSTTHSVWANTAVINTTSGFTGGLSMYITAGNYDVWTGASIRQRITSSGNILIGSTTDSGEKLQVTGTMKVTGASTFGGNTTLSGSGLMNHQIVSTSGAGFSYLILKNSATNGREYHVGLGGDGVGALQNRFFIVDATASATRFSIDSTGASTFSSSVTAAGYNSTGGNGYQVINSASTTVTALRPTGGGTSVMSTNSNGLHIAVGTQAAGDLILASNNTERIRLSSNGFFSQINATNPSSSITDSYIQYSADVVAGNAAPHFRTENGAVIKLYQETTAVGNSIISLGGGSAVLDDTTFDGYTLRQIVKALRNQGILQ